MTDRVANSRESATPCSSPVRSPGFFFWSGPARSPIAQLWSRGSDVAGVASDVPCYESAGVSRSGLVLMLVSDDVAGADPADPPCPVAELQQSTRPFCRVVRCRLCRDLAGGGRRAAHSELAAALFARQSMRGGRLPLRADLAVLTDQAALSQSRPRAYLPGRVWPCGRLRCASFRRDPWHLVCGILLGVDDFPDAAASQDTSPAMAAVAFLIFSERARPAGRPRWSWRLSGKLMRLIVRTGAYA